MRTSYSYLGKIKLYFGKFCPIRKKSRTRTKTRTRTKQVLLLTIPVVSRTNPVIFRKNPVIFSTNKVIFRTNIVIFMTNSVMVKTKKQSYFEQIQSYLGQIQSYLGQTQSYLGQIQLYLEQIQLHLELVSSSSGVRCQVLGVRWLNGLDIPHIKLWPLQTDGVVFGQNLCKGLPSDMAWRLLHPGHWITAHYCFRKSATGHWPVEWEFEENFSDLQTLVSTREDGGSNIKVTNNLQ